MSGANDAPRQLIVFGDSGVHGWGDREAGGWCQRLRLRWMILQNAPVVYPLGVRGDGLERVAARHAPDRRRGRQKYFFCC